MIPLRYSKVFTSCCNKVVAMFLIPVTKLPPDKEIINISETSRFITEEMLIAKKSSLTTAYAIMADVKRMGGLDRVDTLLVLCQEDETGAC